MPVLLFVVSAQAGPSGTPLPSSISAFVWDDVDQKWETGNPSGYTEADTAAMAIEIGDSVTGTFDLTVCLQVHESPFTGAFGFTAFNVWNADFQPDHLPPSTGGGGPDISDDPGEGFTDPEWDGTGGLIWGYDVSIDFVGAPRQPTGPTAPNGLPDCPTNYLAIDVVLGKTASDAPGFVLYGGLLAAPGATLPAGTWPEGLTTVPTVGCNMGSDSYPNGPDGCGASHMTGVFQSRLSNPAKTINFSPSAISPATEVTVTKTATPSWTRTYAWSLTKSVDRPLWKVFVGDTATSNYAVRAEASPTDAITVSGEITIDNPGTEAVSVAGVTDTYVNGGETSLALADCDGAPFPLEVAAGEAAVCPYTLTLASATDGTNTAFASVAGVGNVPSEPVALDFPAQPIVGAGGTASLTDDSPAWPGDQVLSAASSPYEFTYERTFPCATVGTTAYPNTATLTPDGQSPLQASKSVTVRCFALDVQKTAEVRFKRIWDWKIKKYASHKQVVLARKKDPGAKKSDFHLIRYAKSATVSYAVEVWAEKRDRDARVVGTIDITNPAGSMRNAPVTAVTDTLLDPSEAAEVSNCRIVGGDPRPGPTRVIPSGETLRCDYVARPSEQSSQNEATATLRNRAFEQGQTPMTIGSTDFTTTIGVDWGAAPTTVVDRRAAVYDTRLGFLGWATAPGPKRFEYSLLVKPGEHGAPLCGKGELYNRASVVGSDTDRRSEDSVRVPVTVLCFEAAGSGDKKDAGDGKDPGGQKDGGGSLDPKIDPDQAGASVNDQGKIDGVRASDGPAVILCAPAYLGERGARSDPVWKKIGPRGMKTRFFKAGKKVTYAKALRRGGKNPYYRLASVYVTAKLHALAGVPVDARTSQAMIWADRYFAKKKPGATSPKRALSGKAKKAKRTMAKHAKTLKRFNKGAKRYKHAGCDTAP